VKEAEQHEVEDNLRKAKIDAKNSLETVCYQTQQQFGEKIPAVKSYVENMLTWIEESSENASTEELQAKLKELQEFVSAEVQKSGVNPNSNASQNGTSEANIDEID